MGFKTVTNYIKENIIGQVAFEDLDVTMPKDVFVELKEGELYNVVRGESTNDLRSSPRVDYLDIDEIISKLENLKNLGAKHIQIYPNKYDHSYHLTGVTLEKMSDDEVELTRVSKLKRHISAVRQSIVSSENSIESGKKQLIELEKEL